MLNGLGGSWTQLTELDTGTVSYTLGDCLALLQSMRSLQKLGIRVDRGDGVVERHHRDPFSHPLVSLRDRAERVDRTLFDHITLPSLRNLYICAPDSDWSFIPFLERSSPPLQHFSLRVPDEVNGLWADNITQILQHIPSLHSLCLKIGSSEWELGSFLKGLSPRILDTGQVKCFIPRLNTISIQLDCQLAAIDYEALREMVVLRCSVAQNTSAGDNISSPIAQIRKVEVECWYEEAYENSEDDRIMWYEKVSEILAPLEEVVDILRIVIV